MGQAPDYWDNDYFDDTYFHNGEAVQIDGFCTDIWFENAMNFIKKNKDDPFFCYIVPNAPHGPFNVANNYVEPYKDNPEIVNPEFYGLIANIDENMGLLMDFLDELKIADNTIFIFLTDNGTAGGANVKPNNDGFLQKGFNAGMRGTKSSMYEGGHRVPFFIRWPKAGIGGGKDVDELTAHVDLLPTIIDMLDLDFDENYKFDGQSIADLITGISTKKERKLIVDSQRIQTPEKWRRSSVMDGKWRLINGQELYNIANDPEQKNDIANENPGIVEEMAAFYENWWTDLSPGLNHFPAIVIGSENEPLSVITSHDIHTEIVAWNHGQIRDGLVSNGEWILKVEEKASYRIALRRWPVETDAAIGSAVETSPAVEGTTVLESVEGKALNIVSAGLKIGNYNHSIEVETEDKEAVFTVDLEAGLTRMEAFFTKADKVQMAAFYVYINKL